MPYNLSSLTASDNLFGVFAAVNTASGGLFANLALVTIFVGVMSMSLLRQNPPQESFFFAGVVTAISSLVFIYSGLTPIVWLVGSVLVMVGAGISLYTRR